MKEICIIGGGLAGLTSAIALQKAGISVCLLEKNKYPFHKVCGEYVSNEISAYLNSLDCNPYDMGAAHINQLSIIGMNGRKASAPLELGGMGISRFKLDYFLYQKALEIGVEIKEQSSVKEISYFENHHEIKYNHHDSDKTHIVIGAYGKRSRLDQNLNRTFIQKTSPWVGIKYHIKTDFPKNQIALFNIPDGYCGLNKIEDDLYCLCYLVKRSQLRQYGNIAELEAQLFKKNVALKSLMQGSKIMWRKPEVINEISFEQKELVKDHIFMVGDTAGMIAPLFGNGMAMAIHGGKLLAENILECMDSKISRQQLEHNYTKAWQKTFKKRLKRGQWFQKLYQKPLFAEWAVMVLSLSPFLLKKVVELSHGKKIKV